LGCTVFIALAVCLGALIQACAKCRGRLREDIAAREPLLTFAVMTVPFAAGYIALLALRGSDSLYDRYLLPVAVIAALLAGGLATRLGKDKPGFASAVTLLILTSFGIANTHDFYATHRATLDLAQSLTNRGVPRHSVSGGYEYDGWTQLEEKGLMAPPPEPGLPAARSLPERIWYMPMTDVVVPCYYIVSSPQTDAGAIVRKIDYPAWLSPGTRSLWIQRAAGRTAANCGDLPARNAIAHR
jgi:hypothetical protein